MPRIADVLDRESRSVDLEQGDFERLLHRRERKQRNRRIRAGAVGVIVTLAMGLAFARSLTSDEIPADRPVEPRPAPVASGSLAYALLGDIYVADPDGSNAVKIAAAGIPNAACERVSQYSIPSWSPDGEYLAYQRDCASPDGSDMVITDPAGTVVAEFPKGLWGFSWSPDSTRIAVWRNSSEPTIGVYDLDGVRQASLPLPPITGGGNDSAPAWMPDGSALLVFGYVVVPLDGSPGTSSRWVGRRCTRRTGRWSP